MTTPNLDMWPAIMSHRVDMSSDQYATREFGQYKKLPEGVAIITVVNRSQGPIRIVYYDGKNFDNELELLPQGATRVIHRVVSPDAAGLRIDLAAGHQKKGYVGWQAVVTPPTP